MKTTMVGWFWVKWPFETIFQSISDRLPKRGRKRKERIDESKNVQTTPPAPTASAVGPCPTVFQIVGRPGTGSLPSTIAKTTMVHHFSFSRVLLFESKHCAQTYMYFKQIQVYRFWLTGHRDKLMMIIF